MIRTLLTFLTATLLWTSLATAHKLDPGYADLTEVAPDTWTVFWRKPDVNGAPMAIDLSLPGLCEPDTGPQPSFDGSGWSAQWSLSCGGDIYGQVISVPGLASQQTDVLLTIRPLDEPVITTRLTNSDNAFVVPQMPGILDVFLGYFGLGFEHILEGVDHLLFVFALLVLIKDRWRLVGAVTAFTVSHSITLGLSSLGVLNVPGPPVETVIALSIVFLAIEILRTRQGHASLGARYPWVIAFGFGLLHGLGFAGALSDIGLPETDIVTALFAFNIGVEAGQLVFIAVVLTAGAILARASKMVFNTSSFRNPATTLFAGYGIGMIATYWFAERIASF